MISSTIAAPDAPASRRRSVSPPWQGRYRKSVFARRLAREGAAVVICAAVGKVAGEIAGEGGTAEAHQFDLADTSACVQAVDDMVARHGRSKIAMG
ncbi:hypothetical protein ABZ192_40145 [Streptomyces sp. NPDC006235]|uniref:hypothetical protein n=1 Tax=Streptomyces sp. NPDC006235 TaxID=3156736 RepID=UPI0033AD3C4A